MCSHTGTMHGSICTIMISHISMISHTYPPHAVHTHHTRSISTTQTNTNTHQVHESRLVRDCIFVAQGLEGNFVRFADGTQEDQPIGDVLCELQNGTVECQVVKKLAELGWLVRRVQSLIDVSTSPCSLLPPPSSTVGGGSSTVGSAGDIPADMYGRVRQAFCAAARQELHSYFKLMAYLESFLNVPMPQPGQPGVGGGGG